ncbi:MAG: methyltransferase domain-containing protein [Acidobacteriota bacterium]
MALSCPIDLDVTRLRAEVQTIYGRVAAHPDGDFHFHRGPAYAVARLSYDAAALAQVPDATTASFAGVGNPHLVAPLAAGATVADLGCGAGTDLLLAARQVGPSGRAIGVDMTEAMAARARAGAEAMGLANVDVRLGDLTALPISDRSVDVVMSNGVLNLVPDKARAVEEMFRVLVPGGRLQLADIVLGADLEEEARRDVDLWTG